MTNATSLPTCGCAAALALALGAAAAAAECRLSHDQVKNSEEFTRLMSAASALLTSSGILTAEEYREDGHSLRVNLAVAHVLGRQAAYLGAAQDRRDMFDCLMQVGRHGAEVTDLYFFNFAGAGENFQRAALGLLTDDQLRAAGIDPRQEVGSIFETAAPPQPVADGAKAPAQDAPAGSAGIRARIENEPYNCRKAGNLRVSFVLCDLAYSLENTTEGYIRWTVGQWETMREDGGAPKRQTLSYRRDGIDPGPEGSIVLPSYCIIPDGSESSDWRAWGSGIDPAGGPELAWSLETTCVDRAGE